MLYVPFSCTPHPPPLEVHTYTLRPEARFLLPHLPQANVSSEYDLLLLGPKWPGGAVAVDGVFTDLMPSLMEWEQHHTRSTVRQKQKWQWHRPPHGLHQGQAQSWYGTRGHTSARKVAGAVDQDILGGRETVGRKARGGVGPAHLESGHGGRLLQWSDGVDKEVLTGAAAAAAGAPELQPPDEMDPGLGGERRYGENRLVREMEVEGRRGWLPSGGVRVWSGELKCPVYHPPAGG